MVCRSCRLAFWAFHCKVRWYGISCCCSCWCSPLSGPTTCFVHLLVAPFVRCMMPRSPRLPSVLMYAATRVFVLSTALTGLMGALYAHYAGFITPASASFTHSVQFVMMAVIGGIGSVAGAVLGAVIVTLLPNLLAGAAEYEVLVVGLILLSTVLLLPRGMVPTLTAWYRGRKGRKAS